jgi:V/A-type H+-transporting ATPase subunit C
MMKQDSTKQMNHFYDVYLELIDANLLKTAFKQYRSHEKIDDSFIDQAVSFTIKKQLKILAKTDSNELKAVLQRFGYPHHIQSLLTAEDKEFSSFALDAAVDSFLISHMQQAPIPYKCTEAKDTFIKRMIDVRTIKHILRAKHLGYDADHCKQLLIDQGFELATWKQEELCNADNTTEVISILEGTQYYPILKKTQDRIGKENTTVQPFTDAIDRFWLHIVKNLSTSFYTTIGPSLRFLEYKQIEIRNLKIIAKGIAENIPSKLISSLLITEEAA